ncbi:HAD-IIIA family hydrolase [uncultured Mailhella sp.]|uniref:HAD family hydrolase n=1 Tax=uncultured Mailhella sp. TaxID=1981031 RepID=UPI003207F1C3
MKYDAIIFDLDGTLLDTLEDLADAVNHALSGCTTVRRSIDEVRSFVGNGVRTLMIRALPGGEESPYFEQAFAAFREYYAAHCRDHTRAYPQIPELLNELSARGVKLGIVSNKSDKEVKELNRAFFGGLFPAALGERPGVRRKPEPDSLLEAMKELCVDKSRTLYVGDSDVDIRTAANAGVPCVSVTWGFRTEDFLRASGASAVIHSPLDLLDLL